MPPFCLSNLRHTSRTGDFPHWCRGFVVPAHERGELLQQDLPGRFLSKKQVIGARQRNIAGARNFGSQLPAVLGQDHVVAIAMHDQCRHLHLPQQPAYVDAGVDFDKSRGICGRG